MKITLAHHQASLSHSALLRGGLILLVTLTLSGCASVRDAGQTHQRIEAAAQATAYYEAVQQAVDATISALVLSPAESTETPADSEASAPAVVAVLPTVPSIASLEALIEGYPGDLNARPSDPGQLDSASYRIDHPGWIGMTGRPQLLVFYSFPDPDNLRGCIDCTYYYPVVYELEVVLWGQVDVLHLYNNDPVITDIMEHYGFNRAEGRWSIGMVLTDAKGTRLRLYRGMLRYEGQTPFETMMTSIRINLENNEEGG